MTSNGGIESLRVGCEPGARLLVNCKAEQNDVCLASMGRVNCADFNSLQRRLCAQPGLDVLQVSTVRGDSSNAICRDRQFANERLQPLYHTLDCPGVVSRLGDRVHAAGTVVAVHENRRHRVGRQNQVGRVLQVSPDIAGVGEVGQSTRLSLLELAL